MSSTFPRTKPSRPGYHVDQVEDFLEEARLAYSADALMPTVITSRGIRSMSFPLQKGGYSPVHVDAALERLEDAFAAREKDRAFASPGGDETWFSEVRATARVIVDRLERPAGSRFKRTSVLTTGYAIGAVDEFAVRLVDYFRNGTELSVEAVRTVAFPSVRRGYDEAQVDYLLDTVVELMLAVR
jgi:DivIVA domain-containing protein